jgi:hypothetical protein
MIHQSRHFMHMNNNHMWLFHIFWVELCQSKILVAPMEIPADLLVEPPYYFSPLSSPTLYPKLYLLQFIVILHLKDIGNDHSGHWEVKIQLWAQPCSCPSFEDFLAQALENGFVIEPLSCGIKKRICNSWHEIQPFLCLWWLNPGKHIPLPMIELFAILFHNFQVWTVCVVTWIHLRIRGSSFDK